MLQNRFSYQSKDNLRTTFGFGLRHEHLYQVTESRNFANDLSPLPQLTDVTDTEDIFLAEQQRTSRFGYIQGEYPFSDDWELTAGVRIDDYSDFGSTTNPRMALVWSGAKDLSSKLLYGRAFRAPSFIDIKEAFDPVLLGNPELKPETINTLEWALNYLLTDDLSVNLSFYRFDADNLIDFVPDQNLTTSSAKNVTRLKGYGSEIDIHYRASQAFTVKFNYAWQKVIDQAHNDDFGDAPTHQAYLSFDLGLTEHFTMFSQIRHIGKSQRNPYDPRPPLGAYTDISLLFKFNQLFSEFQLQLKIDNLLDQDIREPSFGPSAARPIVELPNDIPMAGRSVYLSLSRTW